MNRQNEYEQEKSKQKGCLFYELFSYDAYACGDQHNSCKYYCVSAHWDKRGKYSKVIICHEKMVDSKNRKWNCEKNSSQGCYVFHNLDFIRVLILNQVVNKCMKIFNKD